MVPQKGAKQPKTAKDGSPWWIVGRTQVGLRCTNNNTPGLLGWS